MMDLKCDRHNKKFIIKLENIKEISESSIRHAYFDIGKDLIATSRKLIRTGPKTGKTYLTRLGRKHRASSPGQAPANVTGNLARSIGYKVHGGYQMDFGAEADYAGFLEDGTSKMGKRPYLIKSIEENERNMESHFEANLKKDFTKP